MYVCMDCDMLQDGGVYRPFLDIKEAPWCLHLDEEEEKEREKEEKKNKLTKKEILEKRISKQRHWNPFSIFGSSPPSVELEDVFGLEVNTQGYKYK